MNEVKNSRREVVMGARHSLSHDDMHGPVLNTINLGVTTTTCRYGHGDRLPGASLLGHFCSIHLLCKRDFGEFLEGVFLEGKNVDLGF